MFFLFLFLGAGVLFLNDFFPKKNAAIATGLESQNVLSFATEAEKDSDNDGLKDWEEGLWKTDLNNPDSDDDGTSDGEEVRNKRNPMKAGPDDEYKSIEESPLKDIVKESAAEKDLTLTDIFARDFVSGYFALKDAGQYTAATRDKFIKTLFASVDNTLAEKKYTLADITITQKSDAETLRQYGNALGAVALRYRHLAERKELPVIDNAIKQNDPEKLSALLPILADYEASINAYLVVSVPLVAHEIHLEIINVDRATKDAIAELGKVFTDPIASSIGVKNYRQSMEKNVTITKNLKNFFLENGVSFQNNDPGQIFIQ